MTDIRERALAAIGRALRGLASGTNITTDAVAEGVLIALEEAGAVQEYPDSGQVTAQEIARAIAGLDVDVTRYTSDLSEPIHRGRVVNPEEVGRLIIEQVVLFASSDRTCSRVLTAV